MIAMPVTGYLTSAAGGHDVSFFGLVSLPDLVGRNKAIDEAAGEAHYVFAWAIGTCSRCTSRRSSGTPESSATRC